MKTAIVFTLLLASATAARAQDRVIGLLSLPEVFGKEPCDKFSPSEVRLYAAPDSRSVVGAIRVDRYWTFPPGGGCEGLTVRVHTAGKPDGVDLPTEEYGDETPGAIVLSRSGQWFKVRLADGAAWLLASDRDYFFTLEKLLNFFSATYLTEAFDGRLFSSPGATAPADSRRIPARRYPEFTYVRVLQFRTVGARLWIRVAVLDGPDLAGIDPKPKVTRTGWLPAHAPSGEPTVWFHSRD